MSHEFKITIFSNANLDQSKLYTHIYSIYIIKPKGFVDVPPIHKVTSHGVQSIPTHSFNVHHKTRPFALGSETRAI